MINKANLINLITNKEYMKVRKELTLYAEIINDVSYEIKEGVNQGHHRITFFKAYGCRWVVVMHNGEVIYIDFSHNNFSI